MNIPGTFMYITLSCRESFMMNLRRDKVQSMQCVNKKKKCIVAGHARLVLSRQFKQLGDGSLVAVMERPRPHCESTSHAEGAAERLRYVNPLLAKGLVIHNWRVNKKMRKKCAREWWK